MQSGIEKKQDSIVEIIKEEILAGNIPGGTEMTQKELAESLGVSRMPVREALIILEYQGLVERLPNNHVRVTEFGEDYFKEVFSFCAELEETVLAAGFVLEDEKTRILLTGKEAEEMRIHRQMKEKLSNTFLRKTLHTMLEIYADFAIRCPGYNQEKGLELLKSVLGAQTEERTVLLKKYFSELERVIVEERRRKC